MGFRTILSMKLSEIKLNPDNPRTISKEKLEKLKGSIEEIQRIPTMQEKVKVINEAKRVKFNRVKGLGNSEGTANAE